ncbi:MAG: hypothetical protein HZB56_10550 [Deltaproteobacteria bacterium]|nr:hypothetical protein [Deltaproteobacteria bacterium]
MRTRVALLACLLSLAPVAALAQAMTVSLSRGSDSVINIAECNDSTLTFTVSSWTLAAQPAAGTFYKVFATSATTCHTTLALPANTVELTGGFRDTGGSLTGPGLSAQNAGSVLTSIGTSCTVGSTPNPLRLCVLVYDSTQQNVVAGAQASGSIALDLARPGTPVNVSAASGDGALNVAWAEPTSGTMPARWTADATGVTSIAGQSCQDATGSSGSCSVSGTTQRSCRIRGLANDGCYQVVVTGFSTTDNASVASAVAYGVPKAVQDFWERYQAEGGREAGGCGAGGASLLSLLALAFVAPRLLRRRP